MRTSCQGRRVFPHGSRANPKVPSWPHRAVLAPTLAGDAKRLTGGAFALMGDMETKCEICGKPMKAPPSRVAIGRGRFCGRTCADRGHSLALRGRSDSRVAVPCDWCGARVLRFPSRLLPGKHNFCSLKCRSAYRSRNECGPESPLWKGGGNGRQRYMQTHWSRAVRRRAGFTCELCHRSQEANPTLRLQAHHILSYARYPEHQMDMANGICLCRDCHNQVRRGEIVLDYPRRLP